MEGRWRRERQYCCTYDDGLYHGGYIVLRVTRLNTENGTKLLVMCLRYRGLGYFAINLSLCM